MIRSLLAFSMFVAVVGCGEPGEAEPAATDTVETASQPVEPESTITESSAAAKTVDLAICSYDELQQRIAGHRGKIVVVDYWSTQCPPCMEEFPQLVALSQQYPAEQVVCISASLDFEDFGGNTIESAREHALEFLRKKQATLTNVILNEDSIEIQDDKLGTGVPVVILYDIDGSEKTRFDETLGKPFTYEKDVLPLVEQLVADRFAAESQ